MEDIELDLEYDLDLDLSDETIAETNDISLEEVTDFFEIEELALTEQSAVQPTVNADQVEALSSEITSLEQELTHLMSLAVAASNKANRDHEIAQAAALQASQSASEANSAREAVLRHTTLIEQKKNELAKITSN